MNVTKMTTYLNYGGNCEAAFRFYEKNFGGKINGIMKHGEMPGATDVPADLKDKILHIQMELGSMQLMGSDVPADRFQPMRSVYLALSFDSIADAESAHALLSEGGDVFMPMAETFFAYRFSMLRDRFGTSWMLMNPRPMPS